ncbi:DUF3784 domain-containing protein [Amphibacillus sediminis]|uniref:DUF3784 domain-containing protein n=1 Tax=Amphibacillus sediminis TaxID=360185 RepID=UPI0035710EF5
MFGLIHILLGLLIKKGKMVDLIIGYNNKKHNKEKVAIFFGNHFILLGILVSFVSVIFYLVEEKPIQYDSILSTLFFIFIVLSHVLIVIKLYHKLFTNKF